MEVHHHPHVAKKNFKEYFLEFLMIFLAVTLGFIADNLREHIRDNNEITEDIKSVLMDLESDVMHFDIALDGNTYSYTLSDSLVNLLHSDLSNTSQIYLDARAVTSNINYFYTNSKTFDQMKAAGMLKLIQPRNLIDSLGLYYVTFQLLSSQDDYVRLKNDLVCKDNYLLFDTYVFSQMKVGYDKYNRSHTIVQLPLGHPALLSSDPKTINEVAQNYYYLGAAEKFDCIAAVRQKKLAERLIALIKQDYHLK